jgi:hypothetical protein
MRWRAVSITRHLARLAQAVCNFFRVFYFHTNKLAIKNKFKIIISIPIISHLYQMPGHLSTIKLFFCACALRAHPNKKPRPDQ